MKIWQKLAAAALLAIIAGCGNSSGSGEAASVQESALADTVVAISIATPIGASVDTTFLSGSNSLVVDDRVTIAQTGQLPAVAGLGAGGVQLGAVAIGHSNVFSAGPTTLRSNLHVFGSVKSAGPFTIQLPITVDGGKTSGVSVGSLATSFSVTFPGNNLGDPTIGPDGPVVPLAPGAYGSLNLKGEVDPIVRTRSEGA